MAFRTIDDDDDVMRTDIIDYGIIESYGFDLVTESFDFFDEDDDIVSDEDKVELDEEELITFLNEYYIVNPKLLPDSEFF